MKEEIGLGKLGKLCGGRNGEGDVQRMRRGIGGSDKTMDVDGMREDKQIDGVRNEYLFVNLIDEMSDCMLCFNQKVIICLTG